MSLIQLTWANELPWKIEKVAKASAGNRKIGLVTDSNGDVHMSYTGCTDNICKESLLEYARRNNQGVWQTHFIDDYKKKTGWFSDLVLTPNNTLHILYTDPHPKMRAKHATAPLAPVNEMKWTITPLKNIPGGYWNSLALFNDKVMASMTSFIGGNLDKSVLQFGTLGSNGWELNILDNSTEAGWLTHLSVSNTGLAAISYIRNAYPAGTMVIKYQVAEAGGIQWKELELDNRSIKSSLVHDKNGIIHGLYQR